MPVTDTILSRLAGTLLTVFRIRDVLIKRETSGIVGFRDNTDAAYVILRAGDPVGNDDVVTKRYLDSTGAGGTVESVEFAVALVTANSTTQLTANTSLLYAEVHVTTAYTAGATMALLKTGGATIVPTTDINLQTTGIYHIDLGNTSWGAGAATVQATIAGAPAAGASFVRIVSVGAPNT